MKGHNVITSGMDLIDMMGPDATREDYELLQTLVTIALNDPEMWEGDDD